MSKTEIFLAIILGIVTLAQSIYNDWGRKKSNAKLTKVITDQMNGKVSDQSKPEDKA